MKRINIYELTNTGTAADKLAEFLDEYAVPEYFDSVEVGPAATGQGAWDVVCKVSDTDLLAFNFINDGTTAARQSSVNVAVKTADGQSLNLTVADRVDDVGTYGTLYFAYACTHGLSLSATPTGPAILSITKDNAGSTVIVFNLSNTSNQLGLHIGEPTDTNRNKLYAISADSTGLLYTEPRVTEYLGQLMALCPIPVADTDKHTQGVMFMPITQYTTPGLLDIGGVRYHSNGLWCVQD